ncbi:hypothetical protein DVH24_026210 [Malus domestica]|uniref:Uncharacterized protein n=1 Tax=Malus domestica TaxID=3750 RepID=A0A498KKW1_MALDO|nr:hypothetical protein DVH24_026210 [Malus domestica]
MQQYSPSTLAFPARSLVWIAAGGRNYSNSSDLGSDEERDINLHLGSTKKDEAKKGSLTFSDYG